MAYLRELCSMVYKSLTLDTESLIKVIRIDYIKRIIDKLDDKYAKEALKYQLHLSGKEV